MNISDELERILNEMDSDEQKKAQESNVAKQMALLADGGTPTGVTKKTPTGANDLIKELKEQMYGADPVNTYMPTQQDFSAQLMQYLAQMFMPGLVQQGQYNVPTAAHGNYADVPSHASGGSIGYHQPGSLEQNMMALGGHRALPIIMALHKAAQPHSVYVAFDPHQIKSAIANRGTYDIKNPNITKAQGGIV